MSEGTRRRGFFLGAIGGLALALLVLGLGSFVPQPATTLQTTSASMTSQAFTLAVPASEGTQSSSSATQVALPAPTVSSSTMTATSVSGGIEASVASSPPSPGQVVGAVTSVATTTSTTTTTVAETSTSASSATTVVAGVATTAASTQPQLQARPSSLLAALPGQSIGSLIATVSPLVIGLLVAALVYGAYARRQDSAP